MQGYIFDLDGVIVDTAKYHFKAWRVIAGQLGVDLTIQMNEHLKGISREDSLKKIISWSGKQVSLQSFEAMAYHKNQLYLQYISQLTPSDILLGVNLYLEFLKSCGKKIALGSASKNAQYILDRLGISSFFDAVIDGHWVSRAKPDPQVFLLAAQHIGVSSSQCVVFEDSHTGIEAAKCADMCAVAIGNSPLLSKADAIFPTMDYEKIEQFLSNR